jgi:23S rRNA pseudouridine1911/1915/1917 synthase
LAGGFPPSSADAGVPPQADYGGGAWARTATPQPGVRRRRMPHCGFGAWSYDFGMNRRKRRPQGDYGAPQEEEWPIEADEAMDDGIDAPPRPRPPIEVLHNDEDLLVIDKPAGTLIEEGFEDEPSVFEQLARGGLAPDEPGALNVVCPLDVEASGLLLIARQAEAAESLRRQLAEGTVELCYLAIVRGRVTRQSGTCDRAVAPQLAERPPRIDEKRGRPAITDWRMRDGFVGFSLLECRPRTAVAGQIRAHLASDGMVLAVDAACGGAAELRLSSFKAGYHPSKQRPERPLIARLTLHAASVRLVHPRTGAEMKFESPLPKDFRATIYQLNKYGRLPAG